MLDLEIGTWLISLIHFDMAWILSRYLVFWNIFIIAKFLRYSQTWRQWSFQSCKIVHYYQVVSLLSNNTLFINKLANWSVANFLLFPGLFTIYPFTITKFDCKKFCLSFDFETKWRKQIQFGCPIWSCVDFLINLFCDFDDFVQGLSV